MSGGGFAPSRPQDVRPTAPGPRAFPPHPPRRETAWDRKSVDIDEPEQYSLIMISFVRCVVTLLIVAIVVVPIGQLMSSKSSAAPHQLSVKSMRTAGSRVLATAGAAGSQDYVAAATGRVDAPDTVVAYPGFAPDLFVPPRV
jgi:hypothetical protein